MGQSMPARYSVNILGNARWAKIPLIFESPASLAIGPLSFSDRETEDSDDGSGILPHGVKSDVTSSHSEMSAIGFGSTNRHVIPIPAKE